jgi:acetylornithine/N-succinyldiaminopimelate aminotransferase
MISPILPLYERTDINFSHGIGVYLYAINGKKYLDFASGYAANSLGHCHPKMMDALLKQAGKFWHLSNRYKIPGMYEYCKMITDNSFADTLFLANSGAEAVECMIKMARSYFHSQGKHNKYRIITFDGAFHGRTLACATAGSEEKIKGFEPPVEGFDKVKWGDITAVEKAITDKTAGIMIEPIQGEGGMRAATPDFMKALERLCKKYNILLMLDEVQCGMGRTGYLFAYEMYGIKPDLVALGKGLGCGFPISACLATEKVGKAMKPHSHGSTFGGNPLAVAVGSTVFEIICNKDFLKHVRDISQYLKNKLDNLAMKYPEYIDEITGKGLMLGIKFKDQFEIEKVSTYFMDEGLLSMQASNNVMRLTPPLIIEEEHCNEAIEAMERAIKKLKSPVSTVSYKARSVYKKVKDKFTGYA